MASVLPWPPQLAGAVSTRAGWPGSNGSTMGTNGVIAAMAAPVAAGLDAAAPAPPDDPQAARKPTEQASAAVRLIDTIRPMDSPLSRHPWLFAVIVAAAMDGRPPMFP